MYDGICAAMCTPRAYRAMLTATARVATQATATSEPQKDVADFTTWTLRTWTLRTFFGTLRTREIGRCGLGFLDVADFLVQKLDVADLTFLDVAD